MKITTRLQRIAIAVGIAMISSLTGASLTQTQSSAFAEKINAPEPVSSGGYSFDCFTDPEEGLPVTAAYKTDSNGKVGTPIIYWKSTYFKGWSPKERCNAVSERFQGVKDNYPSALGNIAYSTMNGQPVIVAKKDDGGEILLFTLENKGEADKVLEDFQNTMERKAGRDRIYRGVLPSQGGTFSVDLNDLLQYGKQIRLGDRL